MTRSIRAGAMLLATLAGCVDGSDPAPVPEAVSSVDGDAIHAELRAADGSVISALDVVRSDGGTWTLGDDEPRQLVVTAAGSAERLREESSQVFATGVTFVDELPATATAAEEILQVLWLEETQRVRPDIVPYSCEYYDYIEPNCDVQNESCRVTGQTCEELGSGYYCFGPYSDPCGWSGTYWGLSMCSYVYTVKSCTRGICTTRPYDPCY